MSHLQSTAATASLAWPAARRARVLLLALPLLIAVAPASSAAVAGNGQAATQARSTGDFDAIDLHGGIALQLRQGSPVSVVVHADSNLLPLLETVVEGRALQLRWQRDTSVSTGSRVWVEVTAPKIGAVASAGSGDIAIDAMKVPKLSLSTSGSGSVQAKALDNDDLSIDIAGSGSASLAGQAVRLKVDVAGSGKIDAAALRADDVSVDIAGSGNAAVHANRVLTVSIAGSGDVSYSGEPKLQQSIAGSGRLRRR